MGLKRRLRALEKRRPQFPRKRLSLEAQEDVGKLAEQLTNNEPLDFGVICPKTWRELGTRR